jgi:hypothetical protein
MEPGDMHSSECLQHKRKTNNQGIVEQFEQSSSHDESRSTDDDRMHVDTLRPTLTLSYHGLKPLLVHQLADIPIVPNPHLFLAGRW